jgi:2-polyprenyl-6-hydroxyphenyl methylase / 3-demethylubiquinone-9 3-methyltransferase
MEATHGVNNEIYSTLGERWYGAQDDPVALLRAEAAHRNPWVARQLDEVFGGRRCGVLDVGCGAGFLANDLALLGHDVVGVDCAVEALEVAMRHDATRRVLYELGDAMDVPHADSSFDAVCAMDFLEHVEDADRCVAESARVLRSGGLFFFHTFNRNWLSWLVVIKGVEWFVRNTPKDMHILRLFRKPREVAELCARHGLEVRELRGSRPRIGLPLLRMLVTRTVPRDLEFTFTRSTLLGYTGMAVKR